MIKIFIVLILLIINSCKSGKNNEFFETMNIRLIDEDFKDTLRVKIIEYYSKPKRTFSEEYLIPKRPYFLDYELELYGYRDDFFYEDGGLFRKINEDHHFYITSSFGHFKDFKWIPDYIFFSDEPKEYLTLITYNDRFFKEEIFKDFPYAGALNIYKVSMQSVKYDSTFCDTIRTIKFDNLEKTYETVEYKSYDSQFNLVCYGYQTAFKDVRNFTIILPDYIKLKKMREKYGPVFKNKSSDSS